MQPKETTAGPYTSSTAEACLIKWRSLVSSLDQACKDMLQDVIGQAHAVDRHHGWALHKQHCRSMVYLMVKLGQQLGSSL